MIWCISPHCQKPQNPDHFICCQTCHSPLLIEGRYRVTRLLGKGGFGKTYEVTDQLSHLPGSQVNVTKVLKILLLKDEKAIALFQQEARVLEKLDHPGIPKAYHYFTFSPQAQDSLHCLVMEKIEGLDLKDYLKARNLSPISEELALEWLTKLINILAEVHSQNFFHRDIKPTNIMLKADGNLALIDFGSVRETTETYISKIAEEEVTGIISTGYSPAEQAMGKAVPQSDFFAVGRTFVYLLTGKIPGEFQEDSHTGKLIWRDQAPQISPQLADLIDHLMAPFPGNRPQTPQIILKHIEQIRNPNPSSSSSASFQGNSSSSTKVEKIPRNLTKTMTLIAHVMKGLVQTHPYLCATLIIGIGIRVLWSVYQPLESQQIQSLLPPTFANTQEETKPSLLVGSLQEFTASWLADVDFSSIPEGWKSFQGKGVKLLLPEEYEGGNPEKDWDAIARTLQLMVPDYQQRLDAIKQSPNPVALIAFDLQVQDLGFVTSVNITSEFSQGKNLEEYSQYFWMRLSQYSSNIQLIEQKKANQLEAKKIITQVPTENGEMSQLIYLISHQNHFWIITYSTSLEKFEEQFPIFEQSIQSLEIISNMVSNSPDIEIY